ncbi:SDR family oxidoreductase [Ruegeria sp. Ofav3-42]|uniref:SDR family oxidoreductase n=1 Tax=Ruegeria sp. Ofav3-42 TaxID=2917759 RepID=UPI001EF3DCAA|nr:NAD(P)H-binding protein [Ruegeria sp. Ofav3-42]MCG7521772.1 NAD(P)H-binding protein [Ruegeria sp. Ofav3-42]
MTKKITIIGATGHLGHRVTTKLVEKGAEVTAIVRDPIVAKPKLPAQVRLVQGDVSDTASLYSALQGTETLYITLNTESLDTTLPFHTEREGVINIVAAAKETGVQHIMQIAGVDTAYPEFSAEGMAYGTNAIRQGGIDAIKASGIPYTFFYCSFFLDSLPKFLMDNQLAVIGNYVHPIWFTNSSDLAELVFNAIGNDAAKNKEFAVQGQQAKTYTEGATEFLDTYAPEAEISQLPTEAIGQMGLPDEQAVFMEHLLTFVQQLREEMVAGETWEILGKPKHTIASFAKELRDEA